MVEFGDMQLAAVFDQDYGQNFDNYLDHETVERINELFSSTILERGYDTEFDEGTHQLSNKLRALENQILEKRNKKDRSKKYELAAKRLAFDMLREAINGYNGRADRLLDTAGAAIGKAPLMIGKIEGKGKHFIKRGKLFSASINASSAYRFLDRANEIGVMPKDFKKNVSNIIFKDSALMAAKQAVSDILVDIYIDRHQSTDRYDLTELMKQIAAGIRFLVECVRYLSKLKGMVSEKLKVIYLTDSRVGVSDNFSRPLITYFRHLFLQIEVLIEELDSFVNSPTKGFLSSIYTQVSSMIQYNRTKSKEIINEISNKIDKQFIRTQWPDTTVVFDDEISFKKNIFGDIEYLLNQIISKLNLAISMPFEEISKIIDSTHSTRNPAYSSEMSYGNFNLSKNYSAAGESPKIDIHSSRLINSNMRRDKDILEVLFSVTDNLSLVFDENDLKSHDVDRIKDVVGDAIFNRAGLESEVSNYITAEVEASFQRVKSSVPDGKIIGN